MTETTTRYRDARKVAGVKPEIAAASLGVSITTLYSWERGDTAPSAGSIVAMAKLYRTSTDYLLGLA